MSRAKSLEQLATRFVTLLTYGSTSRAKIVGCRLGSEYNQDSFWAGQVDCFCLWTTCEYLQAADASYRLSFDTS
jgi:hypothetical protein